MVRFQDSICHYQHSLILRYPPNMTSSAETVFLHPEAHTSSNSGSPLSEVEQDPIQPLSRLPRLARSPGVREKSTARFSPYTRARKPRASLAVKVDLSRTSSPNKTGLLTPISALRRSDDYDCESEAEVSMICGPDVDDKEPAPVGMRPSLYADDFDDNETTNNDSIASYYFSSEASNRADSTSAIPELPLVTPTIPSSNIKAHVRIASAASTILHVTPAGGEKDTITAAVDPAPATMPSTGSLYRFPSTMLLTTNRLGSSRSLSDTLAPYSSWSDSVEDADMPLLYNAVLRGVRAEDLRAIAADAASEEAAEECISRVAGELFAYAARVAKGEAEVENEEGVERKRVDDQAQGTEAGGWWLADAWRAWRASPGEHA
jgi:hypothetical protein